MMFKRENKLTGLHRPGGGSFQKLENKVPAPTGGQRSRRDHQQTVEIQPPKEPDRAQPPAKRRTRHEGRLDDLPHVFQIPLVRFQCAAKYICTHGGRRNGFTASSTRISISPQAKITLTAKIFSPVPLAESTFTSDRPREPVRVPARPTDWLIE